MSVTASEILARSVTKDETNANSGGSLIRWYSFGSSPLVPLPPDPGAWWAPERDKQLKRAYRTSGLWATAVNIAATRVASMGYDLKGDVGLRTRKAREMLGSAWVELIQKLARDYCTQDNGAFLEVVRASRSPASKVLGFMYLDAGRCIRTGDNEIPVLYVDRLGRPHELRAHQVADFSDMPDDEFFGVGLSATSRAYDDIYMHLSVKTYLREKVTGQRPLAIDFINGISPARVQETVADSKAQADARGYVQYGGLAISASATDQAITHQRLEIASLPDNFNPDTFQEETEIKLAAHIGIDPTELNPKLIGNRALGAGSQAATLDDKQNSKGLIAFRQKIAAFFLDTERWHPLPGGVTFAWSERDLKDQAAKADIAKVRADTRKVQVETGEISAKQSLQMAVDAGDAPASFLEVDETLEETISDEDKAEAGTAETGASSQPNDPPGTSTEQPGAPQPAPLVAPVVKSLTLKEHTGAMIALMLPRPEAQRLRSMWDATGAATKAATPVDEMHCTLLYLGKAAEIAPLKDNIVEAVTNVARGFSPLTGSINGVGAFGPTESSDGLVPIYKSFDSAQLPALRHSIYVAVKAKGWGVTHEEHGFVPHITLDYIKSGEPVPAIELDGFDVVFPAITIAWGDERIDIPLSGRTTALKEWADALTTIKRMPAGASVLTRLEPPAEAPRGVESEAAYWRMVTKQFEEIGAAWVAAVQPEIPQDSGTLAMTPDYTIKNRNTNLVALVLHVGNKERPEVTVRALRFGRKGFGPKKAKVLRFQSKGATVWARKVRGTKGNDFHARAMERIKPQLRAAEKAIGQLAETGMSVDDVAGARVYRTAPPAPSDRKVAAERAAWLKANPGKSKKKELIDALEEGGVL